MNIISASRKTDIPTFYMNWFMERIREEKAYVHNPYQKEAVEVSLKLEDVAAIVFWSKNYKPALKRLIELKDMGYRMYFHYTITGQRKSSEKYVSPLQTNIETFKWISEHFSREQINWRFDPIFFTTKMQENYYLEIFQYMCEELKGFTNSCYTSFVTFYSKVQRNIKRELEGDVPIEISVERQKQLLMKMEIIARKCDIQLYSCCQDHLAEIQGIEKGSCINVPYLSKLFDIDFDSRKAATREECGCYKSFDIGFYNTCPHGCVYCYANLSQSHALKNYKNHDKNSNFILNSEGIKIKEKESEQLSLFD
ncbi:DUF1848 domain-containing protein [Cytobacillus spongiae]|uniref:DUF1848 domain-containing protein n=1 Tax=Cytobacillus spongiae TaxID=2901381 RepID=UPI001F3F21DC|nr:DUF1848 domain-containing protein [Cytobacillus spongiae]UII57069.1 DUF1848 domain-containing protein [Cytobacillus spongiae]